LVAGLSGTRGAAANVSRDAVRRTLMVSQVALSFVLLVTAALLGESYRHLMAVPKGFEPDGLVTARVWLPSTRYPEGGSQNAFFAGLSERIAAVAGAGNVTLASDLPVAGGTNGSVGLADPKFAGGASAVEKRIVAANYFSAIKARLVRG